MTASGLTLARYGELFGVATTTAYRWGRSGFLRVVLDERGVRRIPADELPVAAAVAALHRAGARQPALEILAAWLREIPAADRERVVARTIAVKWASRPSTWSFHPDVENVPQGRLVEIYLLGDLLGSAR